MKTDRLYYEDSHLREFSARVLSCEAGENGYLVTLNATAFYPEGGGQACDTGILGGVRVLDVREKDDLVLHLCDGPLEVGAVVTGNINWARRFDLMQQHSGEHIVSGIVHSMFGYHNVGFHVGSEVMTIDFDGPISSEALTEIETRANAAVWGNLPVNCWYPGKEELLSIFYRTKKELPWPVRLVQIEGVDSCACCGVHVKRTGEIGLIKLLSCVKFHQGVRMELCCGSRALGLIQQIFDQNRQVSQAFSAQMLQTGAAARKMNDLLAAEKLRANTLQTEMFDHIAAQYAGKGNIWLKQVDLNPAQSRDLADKIAQVCCGWAAVISGSEENYSVCIVQKNGDVKSIGQALGARGGGKPGYFQGNIRKNWSDIAAILDNLKENS